MMAQSSSTSSAQPAVIHRHLTLEVLNYCTHGNVRKARSPPLQELRLSGPEWKLETLAHLSEVGFEAISSRADMRYINCSGNHLRSLKDISDTFTYIRIVDASKNDIEFLCGSAQLNRWPRALKYMVELHLAHNRLMEVPDLSSMPGLKVLDVSENAITALNFKQNLIHGKALQRLDLSYNRIEWNSARFERGVAVFAHLRRLAALNIDHNPFCDAIAEYELHILRYVLRNVAKRMANSNFTLNHVSITSDMWQRARAVRKVVALHRSVIDDSKAASSADFSSSSSSSAAAAAASSSSVAQKEAVVREAQRARSLDAMVIAMESVLDDSEGGAEILLSVSRDLRDVVQSDVRAHALLFAGLQSTTTPALSIEIWVQTIKIIVARLPDQINTTMLIAAFCLGIELHGLGDACARAIRDMFCSTSDPISKTRTAIARALEYVREQYLNARYSGTVHVRTRNSFISGLTIVVEAAEADEIRRGCSTMIGQTIKWLNPIDCVSNPPDPELVLRFLAAISAEEVNVRKLALVPQRKVLQLLVNARLRDDIKQSDAQQMTKSDAVVNLVSIITNVCVLDQPVGVFRGATAAEQQADDDGAWQSRAGVTVGIVVAHERYGRGAVASIGVGDEGAAGWIAVSFEGGGAVSRRLNKAAWRAVCIVGEDGALIPTSVWAKEARAHSSATHSAGGGSGVSSSSSSSLRRRKQMNGAEFFVLQPSGEGLHLLLFGAVYKLSFLKPVAQDNAVLFHTVEEHRTIAAMVKCIAALIAGDSTLEALRSLVLTKGLVDVLCKYALLRGGHSEELLLHPKVMASTLQCLETILRTLLARRPAPETHPGWTMSWRAIQRRITLKLDPDSLLSFLGQSTGTIYKKCCKAVAVEEESCDGEGDALSLSEQTSATIHELLFSVVGIIMLYADAAAGGAAHGVDGEREVNADAMHVCAAMNERVPGREELLFRCLECPCDELKLVCVRTLKIVPVAMVAADDLVRMVSYLTQVQNISAGETERVVAGCFDFLTSLLVSDGEVGTNMRKATSEATSEAIVAAIDILEKNSRRDLQEAGLEDEENEKFALSKACVGFLIACSCVPTLRPSFLAQRVLQSVVRILRNEDRCNLQKYRQKDQRVMPTFSTFITDSEEQQNAKRLDALRSAVHLYRPALIERTWAGTDPVTLLFAVAGGSGSTSARPPPIAPSGVVAARVMRRIADILEGMPEPSMTEFRCKIDATFAQTVAEVRKFAAADEVDAQEDSGVDVDEETYLTYSGVVQSVMDTFMISTSSVGGGDGTPADDEAEIRTKSALARSFTATDEMRESKMPDFWRQTPRRVSQNSEVAIAHRNARAKSLETALSPPVIYGDEVQHKDEESRRNERSRSDALVLRTALHQTHQVFLRGGSIEVLMSFVRHAVHSIVATAAASASGTEQGVAGVGQKMLAQGDSKSFREQIVDQRAQFVRYAVGAGSNGVPVRSKPFVEPRDKLVITTARQHLLCSFMADVRVQLRHETGRGKDIVMDDSRTMLFNTASTRSVCPAEASMVAAVLRILLALLQRGDAANRAAAATRLRTREQLESIVSVVASCRAMWTDYLIGAKCMRILEIVVALSPTQGRAPNGSAELLSVVAFGVKRSLEELRRQLALSGTLHRGEQLLLLHTTQAAAAVLKQVPLLPELVQYTDTGLGAIARSEAMAMSTSQLRSVSLGLIEFGIGKLFGVSATKWLARFLLEDAKNRAGCEDIFGAGGKRMRSSSSTCAADAATPAAAASGSARRDTANFDGNGDWFLSREGRASHELKARIGAMTDVFVMVLWGDRDARFRVLDMMACSREATELPLAQRQLASPYMHELLTALRHRVFVEALSTSMRTTPMPEEEEGGSNLLQQLEADDRILAHAKVAREDSSAVPDVHLVITTTKVFFLREPAGEGRAAAAAAHVMLRRRALLIEHAYAIDQIVFAVSGPGQQRMSIRFEVHAATATRAAKMVTHMLYAPNDVFIPSACEILRQLVSARAPERSSLGAWGGSDIDVLSHRAVAAAVLRECGAGYSHGLCAAVTQDAHSRKARRRLLLILAVSSSDNESKFKMLLLRENTALWRASAPWSEMRRDAAQRYENELQAFNEHKASAEWERTAFDEKERAIGRSREQRMAVVDADQQDFEAKVRQYITLERAVDFEDITRVVFGDSKVSACVRGK